MALLKTFFILFLVIFPFAQFTRIDLGNNVAIVLSDIVLVLLFLTWIFYVLKLRCQARSPGGWTTLAPLTKPIFIFTFIAFFSLVFNLKNLELNQFIVSFLYNLRWIIYASLYFVVAGFDNKFKEKIPYLMAISGFIVLLIGFVQYFFYPSLRNLFYLGWDEHLYRMFSSFLDPNFAGAFFVLYLILIIGLFLNNLNEKEGFGKLARLHRLAKHGGQGMYGVVGSLSLIAVFLTHSRSAMLMLLVAIFTFLVLYRKIRLAVPFIILFIVFSFVLQNSKIENLNLFRTASSEARIGSSITALQISKENPILGVGFNAYRYAQIRYGFKNEKESALSHADAGTDNSFLFVLATIGIIGFSAYIYLWFKALTKNIKIYKEKKSSSFDRMISVIIISSLTGLFVDSLFINSLFYSSIIQWVWILLGLNSTIRGVHSHTSEV